MAEGERRYDASMIKPVHAPDAVGAEGRWVATWRLRLAAPPSQASYDALVARLAAGPAEPLVEVARVSERDLAVVVTSEHHPMDVESYVDTDGWLLAVDEVAGPIETVNGIRATGGGRSATARLTAGQRETASWVHDSVLGSRAPCAVC